MRSQNSKMATLPVCGGSPKTQIIMAVHIRMAYDVHVNVCANVVVVVNKF